MFESGALTVRHDTLLYFDMRIVLVLYVMSGILLGEMLFIFYEEISVANVE